MTIQELMALADAYAEAAADSYWATGNIFSRADIAEATQLMLDARSALEEALSMTSSFGGL
jgi:hypothetical protein